MLTTTRTTLAVAVLAGVTLWPATASAAESPASCEGRTDADLVLVAHANGRPGAVPKYVLNLETDASGAPAGTLVLGRGAQRLQATTWCRLWQHLPGQPPGPGEETVPEGATTAHAVGQGRTAAGEQVLVRTDVRATEEGLFFRVRYRAPGGDEHADDPTGTGSETDEAWTRVPAEGWYPLDQMRLTSSG